MKKVLYKYMYLNGKNILFGILSACFFGLIAFDSNKYYSVAMLMVPSLLFSFVVGKMCYEEDSKSTKEFLLSMPVSKKNIAMEKNIIGHICILLGFCIVNIMFWITSMVLKKTELFFNVDIMLIVACFLIIYNFIYIYLNYKFDYSKTHFASYVVLALMLILFKFGNEFIKFLGHYNTLQLCVCINFRLSKFINFKAV